MWTATNYDPDDFAHRRHIGPSPSEREHMLDAIGVASVEELIDQTIPRSIRQASELDWAPLTEGEVLARVREVATGNQLMTSLIGQGYYGTVTPPAIQRNIFENPAWYTAYTPYQPEISQGRLEALLNFQTMVSDLTGLPIANASLLDEATAVAEGMAMVRRASKAKSNVFFVDEELHPQVISVLLTRARPLGVECVVRALDSLRADQVFGAALAHLGTHGELRDLSQQCADLHAAKALAVVASDLLALTLVKEPGAMGADVCVGSAQRYGVPMGYGGPHAAFMATTEALKRTMPGRLVGVSVDACGAKAYRLALQTREQHIRREKATSNVCTAQALLAVMASMYAVFQGPQGLRAIAERVHLWTVSVARALRDAGFRVSPEHFFDTLTVHVGERQADVLMNAERRGLNLRRVGRDAVGMSFDETTNADVVGRLLDAFGVDAAAEPATEPALPDEWLRTSAYLTHEVFHMNRAETEMMRYMRRLSDRDLALDRAMIPLGSCTMKLNAAVEMMPVSWPEFAGLHPFAPADQARGYAELVADLEQKLCAITGYDAFSMQPNSGAQGEFAGLMTIARYHRSRGDEQRRICLIPTSAHGTNPASAHMAGLDVVAVKSLDNGDIDLDDFREKADAAGEELAAVMITYPSTHGVFEDTVRQVAEIAHAHGGQVYIDGANMNALVGLVRLGEIGGDVSHLNLHKTFAIPHGGGGPGMGPIGVKQHLVEHLPTDPATGEEGAVSAAAFGSASVLLISWAYLLLMGGQGLKHATESAILNANYIAARLGERYPVLYAGEAGRVAHECILDTRVYAPKVTVDDFAKRLVDHGFHAPTMSFPVTGTLMVEPTESETLFELDRFCDAMLEMADEADAVLRGDIAPEDSPLRHAPHTARSLVGEWNRAYTREQAVFPAGTRNVDKYWPAVGRVDNAYGDRNLICTCPPWGEDNLDA